MNIEELTKSQIFLLTILTSFVTSMATGIVAVALMDQAPTTITQSVSRIIQTSVQPDSPDKNSQPVAAAVAVPLKAEMPEPQKQPSISEIVQSFVPSIVRLYDAGSGGAFVGFGVVMDAQGTIMADVESLGGRPSVNVVLPDGTKLKASAILRDVQHGLVFLSGVSSSSTPPQYAPARSSEAVSVIGQEVIAVFGKESTRIASGLIVAISDGATPALSTDLNAALIERGTPLIDRAGAFVGLSTSVSRAVEGAAFIPASVVTAEYEKARAARSAKEKSP